VVLQLPIRWWLDRLHDEPARLAVELDSAPRATTEDGAPGLSLTWVTGLIGSAEFKMTLSGDTLTLDGGDVPYDVDSNVMFGETILTMTFARQ